MLNVNYYKPTREEAEEFQTYSYEIVNEEHDIIGNFIKHSVPGWCTVPSENPEIIQEQKEWFDMSNREDLIILEKEKQAFDEFYRVHMKDIIKYL